MFTFSIEIFALENHAMALVYFLHFIDGTLCRISTQTMILTVFYVKFFFAKI
jgi:hypothetical protein